MARLLGRRPTARARDRALRSSPRLPAEGERTERPQCRPWSWSERSPASQIASRRAGAPVSADSSASTARQSSPRPAAHLHRPPPARLGERCAECRFDPARADELAADRQLPPVDQAGARSACRGSVRRLAPTRLAARGEQVVADLAEPSSARRQRRTAPLAGGTAIHPGDRRSTTAPRGRAAAQARARRRSRRTIRPTTTTGAGAPVRIARI